MARRFIFSSESVGEGHPDKVCDTISDAVLDACLARDKHSRVACETYAKSNVVIVGGEITIPNLPRGTHLESVIPINRIVRDTVREIGYVHGRPIGISNVVISTQHTGDVKHSEIEKFCVEKVIRKVLPKSMMNGTTKYLINPTGRFVIGGPSGDTGLTGRKIIVDSYGGMGRHGGGAFSGKDPSKVDRSAAYMGRWVAKNVVAAGLARKCEIQFAYAIGHPEPGSVNIDTFCTATVPEEAIQRAIMRIFSFKPADIIEQLDLLRPIYSKTTNYGHFGKIGDPDITWEQTDKADALKKAVR